MNFSTFKFAVASRFSHLQQYPLFRVDIDKDLLWETYLNSFPPGTNEIFRERREYDCSCCRQFIRAIGDVVAIVDGKIETLWDIDIKEQSSWPFQLVADTLSSLVKSRPILSPFLHYESVAGTDKNFEQALSGEVTTWNHFFVNIDCKFVKQKSEIPTLLSEARSRHDVFLRSLREITRDSIETVLDLIAQGSLYRGEEHKASLLQFQTLKQEFARFLSNSSAQDLFAWTADASGVVSRIRNTAIGTLLTDLSEGRDLEESVKSFEVKVAPINYKRPTALITPGMIKKAKETLEEAGLLSALERRYATIRDLNVNDILFTDRSSRKTVNSDVFDDLAANAPTRSKSFDKVEEVSIDRFISEIIPRAESIEILFENRHQSNLVSLIAPCDPTARNLFKWDNNFSWSYAGELADSEMRKAVVARGGSVSGVFRFTHQWNYEKRNASLMDLHVFMPGSQVEPTNGVHDNYGNGERVGWNNRQHFRSGGVQDVDYVNEAPVGYVPVENITFPSLAKMPEGRYICKIHNWHLRHPTQGGFKAEIEFGGQVFDYEVDRPLKNKEWVTVAEVTLNNGTFTIKHHLPAGYQTKVTWGIPTQTFHRVNSLLLSPNYWNESHPVGNKHFFFMLEGCKNDGTARGFYNEFLSEDLNKHRKVFEVLASKTKPEQTERAEDQLSGLGFSSTRRDSVVCRIKGSFTRTIKVVF